MIDGVLGALAAFIFCGLLLAAYLKGRRDSWVQGHAEGLAEGFDEGYDEARDEFWDEAPCDAPSRFTLKNLRKQLH